MATRTTVEIHYDEFHEAWQGTADHLGTLVLTDRRSVHEQLRDVRIACRVDVPSSYVDRSDRPALLYVTPERVREEYGADTAAARETARKTLEAEARDYRAHADGMTFGFVLLTERQCETCSQWKIVSENSCWGFTTSDPEHDLLDWMGEHMDDSGKAALADALDNWAGGYPLAAKGSAEGPPTLHETIQ